MTCSNGQGEGVIASEAKQSLSANPSEANGGEGNKAPQSITPTQALTPVRFATSTRLFEAGTFGGPSLGRVRRRVPASKRRVDIAKRTGSEGVIASEAKQSLSANLAKRAGSEETKHRSQSPPPRPHPRPFRYVTRLFEAGTFGGPSLGEGPPPVPASRRVDVANGRG